jgi:DNA-binding response OmpR family regulator
MTDAKPIVLVVDDDGELAALLAERFALEGWMVHTVLTAADGEAALAAQRPDAVVLDM